MNNSERQFHCPVTDCVWAVPNAEDLRKHVQSDHPLYHGKLIVCRKCQYFFVLISAFINHGFCRYAEQQNPSHPRVLYRCTADNCNKAYIRPRKFFSHMLDVHGTDMRGELPAPEPFGGKRVPWVEPKTYNIDTEPLVAAQRDFRSKNDAKREVVIQTKLDAAFENYRLPDVWAVRVPTDMMTYAEHKTVMNDLRRLGVVLMLPSDKMVIQAEEACYFSGFQKATDGCVPFLAKCQPEYVVA